jgi:hypothetical protein
LQLVAFSGESGIEVQEVSLSFLEKGKGKALFEESIRVEEDLGGDSGFLCTGGHWDEADQGFRGRPQILAGSTTPSSKTSDYSFGSIESEELLNRMKREEGIYGWCRKGTEDWRVFWVGGSLSMGNSSGDP